MKGKTPFKAYFGHKPDVSNLRVFGSTPWAQIPLDKRRDLKLKFDEPLQEVELVKEKTAEFPSYSTEYLDNEIGGDDPNLDPLISDISV